MQSANGIGVGDDGACSDALTALAELRETKEAGKGGFSIFGKR